MSNVVEEVLHDILDVLAGRKNLTGPAADAHHDAITPGFTDKPVTAEEAAAAQAIIDRQAREAAKAAAAAEAAAEPTVEPVASTTAADPGSDVADEEAGA